MRKTPPRKSLPAAVPKLGLTAWLRVGHSLTKLPSSPYLTKYGLNSVLRIGKKLSPATRASVSEKRPRLRPHNRPLGRHKNSKKSPRLENQYSSRLQKRIANTRSASTASLSSVPPESPYPKSLRSCAAVSRTTKPRNCTRLPRSSVRSQISA